MQDTGDMAVPGDLAIVAGSQMGPAHFADMAGTVSEWGYELEETCSVVVEDNVGEGDTAVVGIAAVREYATHAVEVVDTENTADMAAEDAAAWVSHALGSELFAAVGMLRARAYVADDVWVAA